MIRQAQDPGFKRRIALRCRCKRTKATCGKIQPWKVEFIALRQNYFRHRHRHQLAVDANGRNEWQWRLFLLLLLA